MIRSMVAIPDQWPISSMCMHSSNLWWRDLLYREVWVPLAQVHPLSFPLGLPLSITEVNVYLNHFHLKIYYVCLWSPVNLCYSSQVFAASCWNIVSACILLGWLWSLWFWYPNDLPIWFNGNLNLCLFVDAHVTLLVFACLALYFSLPCECLFLLLGFFFPPGVFS